MDKRLILIRGAPGSGKTDLATRIKIVARLRGLSVFHIEADDFFLTDEGIYRYVHEKADYHPFSS